VEEFLGTVGAMVAIAVGVLCGYLLVDAVRPLYRHTVEPALDLLPFRVRPSNWGSMFGGANRGTRGRRGGKNPDV
jgi:hypothetical protein